MAGITFEVCERNATVGGVWLENRYPGAGVDTPNHLYSFSFAPYDWEQYFCLRDELWAYLEHVCDQFDVRRHIRFETSVQQIEYLADRQMWRATVRTADGTIEVKEANVVISAAGLFNPPVEPDIEGLDSWTGERWHTARWPADADLTGKHVAIIGNGASCMQIGPEIQDEVASLTIYQRSNHWAAPFERFRQAVPDPLRYLLREVPLYRDWYRVRLGWTFNDRIHSALQKDPNWEHPERSLNAANDAHRQFFTQYVVSELGDKADELLPKVLPTYPPFGKRMLMDNGWYRMLRNPKVTLVDDRIARIDTNRIVTEDGTEREADVLVLATGFDVLRLVNTYEAVGRTGRTLREAWDDDNAQAYLGTVVPGVPELLHPLRTEPAAGTRWQPHLRRRDAGPLHHGRPAADGRTETGLGRDPTRGSRGLQRRRRRRPHPDGVDPPGDEHVLPQPTWPHRHQFAVPQRRLLRHDQDRQPGGVRDRTDDGRESSSPTEHGARGAEVRM